MSLSLAQKSMGNIAFWMADQICPLLPYLTLHACSATTDLHLVGVAGWIFGGVGLLMLMGISDDIECRKAARRTQVAKRPLVLKLTSDAPIQQTSPNDERPALAERRPLYSRVRSINRRSFVSQREDAAKRIRTAHQ